jgi:uncharacterized protein YegJ (DUF2314 family)
MANGISPERLEEIRKQNQERKDAEKAKTQVVISKEHNLKAEQVENAGYVKAAFHIKGEPDEMVWVKVIKVAGDRVQGAVYRKPERVKMNAGESVVVRVKDIVDTRPKVSGPLDTDTLAKYFPL